MKRCAVECLPERLPTATHSARACEGKRIRMNERVVENDVGAPENLRGAQRQKVRRAGPRSDEIDLAVIGRALPGAGVTRVSDAEVRALRFAPAEQRQRLVYRGLVALAEIVERRERNVDVLAFAQRERIEPAAREIEELVAVHVAERAQLALPAVALRASSRPML